MKWPSGRSLGPYKKERVVTDLSTDKLADLVSKRRACIQQMHKLGMKQAELIGSGEISSLLRVLSVKNQLIVALQTIEQQLAPFHDQDPETRTWASPDARHACAQQAAECKRLLDELMTLERENEAKMTQRRDQIGQQLQVVQSSRSAQQAYRAQNAHVSQSPRSAFTSAGEEVEHLDLHSGR